MQCTCDCLGCAVLPCLVCLFDLACFFLLISHLKTCLVCVNAPLFCPSGMSESCGAHCVNQSTEDHWRMGSAGKNIMAVSTKLHDTDDNEEGEVGTSQRVGGGTTVHLQVYVHMDVLTLNKLTPPYAPPAGQLL